MPRPLNTADPRICKRCGTPQALSRFKTWIRKGRKPPNNIAHDPYCLGCRCKMARARWRNASPAERKLIIETNRKRRQNNPAPYREYFNDFARRWRAKNPYRSNARAIGVDLHAVLALAAKQNGLCALCGNPERDFQNGKRRALSIDHCHKRNQLRELLCRRCNTILGMVNDSPDHLRIAAAYIEKHAGVVSDSYFEGHA